MFFNTNLISLLLKVQFSRDLNIENTELNHMLDNTDSYKPHSLAFISQVLIISTNFNSLFIAQLFSRKTDYKHSGFMSI